MIPLIIERNLSGPVRVEIEAETLLADLPVDDLARQVIALDLGNELGRDIPDAEMLAWQTVADVMVSAGEVVHG